jgi:hypothetical protein
MNNEFEQHGSSGHEVEFEHEDLGTRGIFVFMVGLVVSGAAIYFIIAGMYRFLDNYERSQMTTASPLITTKGSMSRVMSDADVDTMFKENGAPMLERNERLEMGDFVMNQENQLNSYGWVDEKAGVAHIPIEQAMQLTAQRGLPVYVPGKAEAPAAAKAPAKTAAKP